MFFIFHKVNYSSCGSFIVSLIFFRAVLLYIYVVNYYILFIYLFFLLGIRTIVNLWSQNKLVITIIIIINYATKAHLKNAARVDTSKFAKKVDLASFKSEADK